MYSQNHRKQRLKGLRENGAEPSHPRLPPLAKLGVTPAYARGNSSMDMSASS